MPRPGKLAAPRPRLRAAALAALCVLALAAAAGDAVAQDVERADQIERLRAIEAALEESRRQQQQLAADAERLAREFTALQTRLIAAAEQVLGMEAEVAAITARLDGLRAEERARAAAVDRQRRGLSGVLASLVHLARQPPLAVAADPARAVDVVHASLLLSAILPELKARASTASADLQAFRAIRGEIDAQRAELAAAGERLEAERAALAVLLDRKAGEREQSQAQQLAARERAARLGAEAADLRDLLGRLEDDAGPIPPPGARSFEEARGRLPLPAQGRVTRSWGEPDAQGLPARGLSLAVVPDAQIVAPFDGRIVFAGPFRSYGQLLIIAHGGGYHSLIAGLSRIDGFVGQWLLAGEPVGRAGEPAGRAGDDDGDSAIYVELRLHGEPINPLPWLAAR